MTTLTKDRLQDVAVAVVLLPFALLISPLLVLIYWWTCLVDCWHDHKSRHDRNDYLARFVAHESQERGK